MKRRIQNLLIEVIQDEINHYQTEIEFMTHQRTLPPEHRKIAIDDESQFGITLMHFQGKVRDLREALTAVKATKITE
jgi:hypothetical protein